jgi:hypothetical protein
MWYDSFMPAELPNDAIEAAKAAVIFAQQIRKVHRRRTDKNSPKRAQDIEDACARLREAMKPIRSAIGRFPYGPQTTRAEENREIIREVSEEIQRERRKLHKMKNRSDN